MSTNPRKARSDTPKPLRLHGSIARKLGIKIVSGEFRPGDILDGEIAASEHFRVSRTAYREAIRILAAKGLVQSRPKVGTRVSQQRDWHMLDPDVLYWTLNSIPEGEFFRALMTVRRIIEPAAAALAATAATDEDLKRINSAYDQMEHAQNAGALLEPDLEFHRAIMAATHNDMLAYIGNMMSLALSESIKLTSRHPDTHALSLPRHKAILTAILNRDALGARQASLVQLENARVDADSILGFAARGLG